MQQEWVALITGAASGLGHEVARQLAALDHEVIVTAREPRRAHHAARELGPKATALPVGLDIADQTSVDRAVTALTDLTGRLDVLINNAAAYVDWTETATTADLGAGRRGRQLRHQQGRTQRAHQHPGRRTRRHPILANAVCPGLTATAPGMEASGARSAAASAPGVVWAATLPAGGPTGQFFRDRRPLPW